LGDAVANPAAFFDPSSAVMMSVGKVSVLAGDAQALRWETSPLMTSYTRASTCSYGAKNPQGDVVAGACPGLTLSPDTPPAKNKATETTYEAGRRALIAGDNPNAPDDVTN
jgi:hypothetical protein